jgi:hypothetical protein
VYFTDLTQRCLFTNAKNCLSFRSLRFNESKITIEHLKYGGNLTVIILIKLVNLIFQNAAIPSTLKSGIGCPIFKNGGKLKEDPNSLYRRDSVSLLPQYLIRLKQIQLLMELLLP